MIHSVLTFLNFGPSALLVHHFVRCSLTRQGILWACSLWCCLLRWPAERMQPLTSARVVRQLHERCTSASLYLSAQCLCRERVHIHNCPDSTLSGEEEKCWFLWSCFSSRHVAFAGWWGWNACLVRKKSPCWPWECQWLYAPCASQKERAERTLCFGGSRIPNTSWRKPVSLYSVAVYLTFSDYHGYKIELCVHTSQQNGNDLLWQSS